MGLISRMTRATQQFVYTLPICNKHRLRLRIIGKGIIYWNFSIRNHRVKLNGFDFKQVLLDASQMEISHRNETLISWLNFKLHSDTFPFIASSIGSPTNYILPCDVGSFTFRNISIPSNLYSPLFSQQSCEGQSICVAPNINRCLRRPAVIAHRLLILIKSNIHLT